jgi:methionine-rich copper-binding protein CopC
MAALPIAANAQVGLTASSPAPGMTVARPRTVTLTFNGPVAASSVAASIIMTAMPGVENHGEMVIRNFTSALSSDNRMLTLSLRQPLRAGTYDLRWQATGSDGVRANGTVTFTVR